MVRKDTSIVQLKMDDLLAPSLDQVMRQIDLDLNPLLVPQNKNKILTRGDPDIIARLDTHEFFIFPDLTAGFDIKFAQVHAPILTPNDIDIFLVPRNNKMENIARGHDAPPVENFVP